MKVKELINKLKFMPQEMEVKMLVEAGYCAEDIGNVQTYKLGEKIIIALWQE